MNFDTSCFIFWNLDENRIQIQLKKKLWTIEIILNTHTSKNHSQIDTHVDQTKRKRIMKNFEKISFFKNDQN